MSEKTVLLTPERPSSPVAAPVGPACPDMTVVVPTRNERDNIGPLLARLERVRSELDIEVLFVDDSTDDTPAVIAHLARGTSGIVSLLHRREGERVGGLGGAVKAGLLAARSDIVCVMDADLQHPPELVGEMFEEAQRSGADVVVASRYCESGGTGEFSAVRVALSRGSSLAAKGLFPRRLHAVTDPMSGFFLLRRSSLAIADLEPRGFKILLEILLSGRRLETSEVPYRFGERHAGNSKASLREGVRYLQRLLQLRVSARWLRLGGFAAVGALGVGVNTSLLALFAVGMHMWYVLASILATQIAILFNYVLTEWIVFRGVSSTKPWMARIASYAAVNNGSLLLSGPLLVLLVSVLGMGLLVANVVSLLALVVVRFSVADTYIWGSKPLLPRRATQPSAATP